MLNTKRPERNRDGVEHLVFVCHSSQTAGVERSTVALVRAAKRQKARVTVVLPKPGPILDLLNAIDGVEIQYAKAQWWMGREHQGWRGLAKIAHCLIQSFLWWPIIARIHPTAVCVMSTVIPAPMLGARLAGVPVVAFLSESIQTNPNLGSVLPKSIIIKYVTGLASVTVARSHFAAGQYGGASLIEPPDIGDPKDVPAGKPDRGGQLQRLVMLGHLSSEKGQADAVRAVGVARDQGVSLTLEFYGEASPHELTKLNTLIEAQRLTATVRHRGVTSAPLSVLRSADLSLVCSRNEAYGRVTAESLSVGTPVIGYRAGGTAEILAGGGGIAVEPSVAALADALVSVARDGDLFCRIARAAEERQQSKNGFGDADKTIRHVMAALISQDR
ncbi:glycosyltransferase [Mycobacterium hodleri]|uniref:Glycosyltransferase n=1 Tax=Mycolicibacterium hodleri TaxID=49897 RepID=A0A544VZG5_9MYCO|nr:glycosyltransferase [Mycolicibacterium hodleri]